MKTLTLRQKALHARYKAMPVALIQRPLKFLRNRDSYVTTDANGVQTRELGATASLARFCASKGDGAGVQYLARIYA